MKNRILLLLAAGLVCGGLGTLLAPVRAADNGEAQWIWFPEEDVKKAPAATRYFRKLFDAPDELESASVAITCDDEYILYVNGQKVAKGSSWKVLDVHDIQKYTIKGKNILAVECVNQDEETSAGLVARITVKKTSGTAVTIISDASWKVSNTEYDNWTARSFNDAKWPAAVNLGELGEAAPWRDQVKLPGDAGAGRFKTLAGFRVERVASPKGTGSLIAMTFNERGEIICARENGPLLVLRDADGDGETFEDIREYANQMTACQGILALNGQIFAVGNGPQGTSFCRLTDVDGDGQADKLETLFKFNGAMGEHGPHAVLMGPDGLLYIAIGNHANVAMEYAATSPHHNFYDGELLTPKYEDPRGHAHGLKAPGGTVVRTDTDGSFCELFCGGFRNHYDIAFNRDGELFTYDSDMEWDEGLPWYRPTRVNHATSGSEFGWRSGWSVWPDYFPDALPATINTGRGSPTGVEFYNHLRYPAKYHDALFACDWSQGRILAITMKRDGGTYAAEEELFLEGTPLNVTDLAVGPDGWLYFCTGGRGTDGGIFRIVYEGDIAPPVAQEGIMRAIRMPQLYSAWGRDRIARIKDRMGEEDWTAELLRVAEDTKSPTNDRCRAMDLMQQMGPFPSKRLLVKLGNDRDPQVRSKAAYLMGIHIDESTNAQLVRMLGDTDNTVKRVACDSLARAAAQAPAAEVLKLLNDKNPYVAWAARRALERIPRGQWQPAILSAKEPLVFTRGAIALITLEPDAVTIKAILERCYQLIQTTSISDDEFLGVLRVIELTLVRGQLTKDDHPKLAKQLAEEYPTGDWRLNRELVRLIVYLQEPSALARMMKELGRAKANTEKQEELTKEKIHLAMHLRFLSEGWKPEERGRLLAFYEYARTLPGGFSFGPYLDNAARDFMGQLPEEQQFEILAQGAVMPGVALQVLRGLKSPPKASQISTLTELDDALEDVEGPAARELRTGLLAVLGISGENEALKHLHKAFESQPERRQDVAFAISAFSQTGRRRADDYRLLLRSLGLVEGPAAQSVLQALVKFRERGTKPELQRQVILLGLRLKEEGGADAVKLLEHWTAQKVSEPDDTWEVALEGWQAWFAEKYPDVPPAILPVEPSGSKYTYDQLAHFLAAEGSKGDPEKGRIVFEQKGQCIKCHRHGPKGEGVGPDLSTVSQRFQKKEVLESLMFPSLVISDQYSSKAVTTKQGQVYVGIVGPAGNDSIVVLTPEAKKVELKKIDIEETAASAKSAMPEGLLNSLTQEEIADLFAFLLTPIR